jgi:hypothetical protein
MASTAMQAFSEFKDRNALTAAQRRNIRDRKDTVTRYLREDGWIIETSIFGGSHARRTKVRLPNDAKTDVDVYVVLDPRHKRYGGLLQPAPSQLLSDIKRSLDKRLETPSVRADSPSVRIRYSDMDVDVVPAFRRHWILGSGFSIPYYDGWLVATPEQQRSVFAKLNGRLDSRLVHLVRMLKYWKACHSSFPLRSYHLEVLAYHVFDRLPPDDYRHAIANFFKQAQTFVRYRWNDPGGSGKSVSGYMTRAQQANAISMFSSAAARAQRALDASSWKEEIDIWRSSTMFGSRFPAYTS